jgi:hypothetical protein
MAVLYAMAKSAPRRNAAGFTFWDGTIPGRRRGWHTVTDLLLSWDGRWYTLIASNGYGAAGRLDHNGIANNARLAFFPLYPALIRATDWVPGLGIGRAALLVSLVSSIAAACGIFAVGNHLRGRAFGIVLAGLWAVVPTCYVQNAAFTESLFTALAAWALYAVLTRRWVLAGILTLVCGLSRPTAIAVIAGVGLAALVAAVRRRDGWRPYVGALLAPIGYVGYLAYADSRLGGLTGYFTLQRQHFNSHYDFGRHTISVLGDILFGTAQTNNQITLWAGLVVIATLLLLAILIIQRVPLAVVTFAVLLAAQALGTNTDFTSMPRHLMPEFPLLIPLAAIVSAKVGTRRGRLAVGVALVAVALLSGWYGGWLPLHSGAVI